MYDIYYHGIFSEVRSFVCRLLSSISMRLVLEVQVCVD
jgi:hypothetical protein